MPSIISNSFIYFLDTLDVLLQCHVHVLTDYTNIVYDLRLPLLSEQEVNAIDRTRIIARGHVYARMLSENIIRGDKNDLATLITYLKSDSSLKHMAEYWEIICKLSLVARY